MRTPPGMAGFALARGGCTRPSASPDAEIHPITIAMRQSARPAFTRTPRSQSPVVAVEAYPSGVQEYGSGVSPSASQKRSIVAGSVNVSGSVNTAE